MKRDYKIVIENNFEDKVTLVIEPWCVEYGMMPKDKFEIIEEEAGDDFHFHIIFEEKHILVCAEGSESNYPIVCQNGEELEFRHNLR